MTDFEIQSIFKNFKTLTKKTIPSTLSRFLRWQQLPSVAEKRTKTFAFVAKNRKTTRNQSPNQPSTYQSVRAANQPTTGRQFYVCGVIGCVINFNDNDRPAIFKLVGVVVGCLIRTDLCTVKPRQLHRLDSEQESNSLLSDYSLLFTIINFPVYQLK